MLLHSFFIILDDYVVHINSQCVKMTEDNLKLKKKYWCKTVRLSLTRNLQFRTLLFTPPLSFIFFYICLFIRYKHVFVYSLTHLIRTQCTCLKIQISESSRGWPLFLRKGHIFLAIRVSSKFGLHPRCFECYFKKTLDHVIPSKHDDILFNRQFT